MRNCFFIVLLVPVLVGNVTAAAYRCQGPEGSVVYQDRPCDTDSVQRLVPGTDTSRSSSPEPRTTELTPEESQMLKQQKLRQAEESRELMEGMDEAAVRQVLGEPDKINRSVSKQGVTREQWIYYEKDKNGRVVRGKSTSITLRNGKLTKWSIDPSKRP